MARFYRLVRLVIDLLVLRGHTDRSKDVEILVCATNSECCTGEIPRPRFDADDRAFLSPMARVIAQDRCRSSS